MNSAGYELIEAVDGLEGVATAEREQPDLILMDIQLPGIDGYEATRRIRAIPALAQVPIIAVTSYALSGDEAKTRAAGCDGYVAKPFSPRQLLAQKSRPRLFACRVWTASAAAAGAASTCCWNAVTPPLILVVDDVADNVEILQLRLESQGYEVITAADGEAALAAIRDSCPTSCCSTS